MTLLGRIKTAKSFRTEFLLPKMADFRNDQKLEDLEVLRVQFLRLHQETLVVLESDVEPPTVRLWISVASPSEQNEKRNC